MQLKDPWFLLLFILLPIYLKYGYKRQALVYSSIKVVKSIRPSIKVRLRHLPKVLNMLALALIIFALARPQLANQEREVSTKGTDIILALDISGSMKA